MTVATPGTDTAPTPPETGIAGGKSLRAGIGNPRDCSTQYRSMIEREDYAIEHFIDLRSKSRNHAVDQANRHVLLLNMQTHAGDRPIACRALNAHLDGKHPSAC